MRLKTILAFVLLSALGLAAFSQSAVTYRLGLENIMHHELAITVTFTDLKKDTLIISMPNTSPGRYATHNFAKNLYAEKAFDQEGQVLQLKRISPFSWKMPVRNGHVRFEYTLFGHYADGTYTGIDSRKLHMNMPATFVYGEGLDETPVELIIDLKTQPNWSVATQLVKQNDSTYTAPDYYYFYDSPTMVGDIDGRSWQVDGQTIEVAMIHEGTDAELDSYVVWCQKIVQEEKNIFGELPRFDYGRYTFLMAYNPWVHGDGMEHRNSTVCTGNGSLASNADQLIGTIAHEFFHAWNMERIRPASLEPFDFDKANLAGELWFGEGFTSYYDRLVLCRAGIKSPEQYLAGLSGTMNYVLNFPGREFRGPIQMSYHAPFVDAATANDETNYYNNFISYYSYGEVLGLALDLMLRSDFNDVTLDDYMLYVWEKFGKPEISYTISDLEAALTAVTNDKDFSENYFNRYVYTSELPDFEKLFRKFGIAMRPTRKSALLGNVKLNSNGVITSDIRRNTALYDAGVEKGDKIITVGNLKITSQKDLKEIFDTMELGKAYSVSYTQLGRERTGTFIAKPDPAFGLTFISDTSKNAIKRRNAWLGVE